MAGSKLDGAGMAKMHTIEDALAIVQTLHGIVERMALAVRAQQTTAQFGMQVRRQGTPLVGLLKSQFGMISDQAAQLLLIATRGGQEQVKLRAMREGVAQIRTALEIAANKVKEQHSSVVELAPEDGAS